jgi:hypothetical protein
MFFLAGFTLQVSPNSCRSALDLERNMKRNLWEALASFSATYHRMTSLLTSLSGSVWKGKRNNIFFRGMWTNVWKRVEIGKKGAVFGVGFSQHCLYRSAFCRCLVGCSVLHYSFVRAPLVQKTLMASAKPSWWSHLPDSTKGRKKMHWNPKSEWHIDTTWNLLTSSCILSRGKCTTPCSNTCYIMLFWVRLKVSCERTLGSKGTACGCEALLLDVRSLQGKVSKQIPVSRKREKENHAPHVFFNFAPGYTLTDCLLSCSVQSSKIPTLFRGEGDSKCNLHFCRRASCRKRHKLTQFSRTNRT